MARGVTGGTSLSIASDAALNIVAGDFTVSIWCYPTALDGATRTLLFKAGGPGAEELAVQRHSSGAFWVIGLGNDGDAVFPSPDLTTGAWQHVAVRRSGSTCTLWVGGTLAATWTRANNGTASTPLYIGANNAAGQGWDGGLAELALWGRALADAEIVGLARSLSPSHFRRGGVEYWPLHGSLSPEPGRWRGLDATVSGATKGASHPRVIPPARTRIALPAAETDITGSVGQAAETDTAGGISGLKRLGLGQASETSSAGDVEPGKAAGIGLAIETDSALAIAITKLLAVGQAVETDLAMSIAPAKRRVVAQADESDTAAGVVPAKRLAIGQTSETDTAADIEADTEGDEIIESVGMATETDSAGTITPIKRRLVGMALEASIARAISLGGQVQQTGMLLGVGA